MATGALIDMAGFYVAPRWRQALECTRCSAKADHVGLNRT